MFTKLTHNDGAGAGFAGGSTAFCYGTAEYSSFEIGDTNEEIPNHFFDYCDDIFI